MLTNKLKLMLLREVGGRSGRHPDPERDPLHRKHALRWSATRKAAHDGVEMEAFRRVLRGAEATVRGGVIADLAAYHRTDHEDVVRRCLGWEEESLRQWSAADRSDPVGLREFFQHTDSWTYDLLWYAYLQAEGYAYPQSVVVAQWLSTRPHGRRSLDFGSGAGATAQMFEALGYEVALADVAPPLLAFAQFRLERRGQTATLLNLNSQALPRAAYDVITAFDTLIHVPDVGETARGLHAAMRPGGYLFAGYEVRRHTTRSAYHLYDDDLMLRYAVQRAGFEPAGLIDDIIWCYRRVDPAGWRHRVRGWRDWTLLAGPQAVAVRSLRRALAYRAIRILRPFLPELRDE